MRPSSGRASRSSSDVVAVHSPTADPSHGWEAFRNHTFNGTYWAVRRWRPASTSDRLGWEVMMARDLRPRRFGSEKAAARAADAANRNGGVPPEKPLSPAQVAYLVSFGKDYLRSNPKQAAAPRAVFEAGLLGAEFDDWCVMPPDLAKAKVLRSRGYFRVFKVSRQLGRVYVRLQVAFRDAGAAAAYDALVAAGLVAPPRRAPARASR